ncbi:MAG: hypothetical protein KDA96_03525 [Planctomycetaceae bacterium]|nr:hypothetical protein [Planctomycetaceae bacterium]
MRICRLLSSTVCRCTMMAAFVGAISSPTAILAQVKDFPYDARVVSDEVFIRSGGGESFYPTQRLTRDARITVFRHDPGGWYMITPPEGAFSWIPARYVQRVSETEGVVQNVDEKGREANTPVFAGSDFGDDAYVYQVALRNGTRVHIKGQQILTTETGREDMFRIEPPKREFRWIPGSAVVPVDERVRVQHNSDPYAVPSNVERRAPGVATAQAEGGVTEVPPVSVPVTSRMVQLQNIRAERERLADIDRRFQEMLHREPSEWDLNTIESDYRSLQNSATHKPLAGQIELRFPAIQRYRQRKAEYDDFKRLTSETERKDSELLASGNLSNQMAFAPFSAGPEQFAAAGMAPQLSDNILFGDDSIIAQNPGPAPPETAGVTGPSVSFNGTTSAPFPLESAGTPDALAGAGGGRIDGRSRYVGAGVIQKTPGSEGADHYVLMTPSGRVLAHVTGTGDVSLEDYVGKQVGVHGRRFFKREINSDYIEISGLETVRLQ